MGHATDPQPPAPTPRTTPLPSAAQAALARLEHALTPAPTPLAQTFDRDELADRTSWRPIGIRQKAGDRL